VKKTILSKIKEMDERLQDFSENGSGWVLSDILCIDLTFTTLGGLRGGCSFPYPETRGLLNIQSNDNLCIIYCIIAFFHSYSVPANQRRKCEEYKKFMHNISLDGVSFPIHPNDLSILEEKTNISNFQ